VLVALVGEPLVDLVAEAQCVVLDAQVRDHLQLISGEDLEREDRPTLLG
jgi:hypothetical protein